MGPVAAAVEAARRQRGGAVLAVVNVTPDSFHDGGQWLEPGAARERVARALAEGADVLDLGAESSRPGSTPVAAAEQLRRLGPALEAALGAGALVSVDTTSPEVAEAVLARGAHAINDVSCLAELELARVVARRGAELFLMHARGAMTSMAGFSQHPDAAYGDVVAEVAAEWSAARDRAVAVGVPAAHIWFDPGLGFAKNARHSLTLLRRLGEFARLGHPVLVGPGRKSFLAALDPAPPAGRLGGTVAACLAAADRGAALLRVHDVQVVRQALITHAALRAPAHEGEPARPPAAPRAPTGVAP